MILAIATPEGRELNTQENEFGEMFFVNEDRTKIKFMDIGWGDPHNAENVDNKINKTIQSITLFCAFFSDGCVNLYSNKMPLSLYQ